MSCHIPLYQILIIQIRWTDPIPSFCNFIPKNPFGTALATHISVPQAGKSRANPRNLRFHGPGHRSVVVFSNLIVPMKAPIRLAEVLHSPTMGGGCVLPPEEVRGTKPTPRLPSVGNKKGGGFGFCPPFLSPVPGYRGVHQI